jgi:hypothetical protein
MPTQSPLTNELRELYESESSRLRKNFSANKDGLSFLREHSGLVESLALRLWEQIVSQEARAPAGDQ